jgi:Uma2 family endonuclease
LNCTALVTSEIEAAPARRNRSGTQHQARRSLGHHAQSIDFVHHHRYHPTMNALLPQRLTVDEFLNWSQQQPKGRYELQDGRVIMQQSQNWAHLRIKAALYSELYQAVKRSGAPVYAATDGATVRISNRIAFEPDALVAHLPMPDDAELEINNPVIVCEVLSPSSIKRDLTEKLAGYFQVATIMHYLVCDPDDKAIIWHQRAPGGGIQPPIVMTSGILRLDTPGLDLPVEPVFAS